jgi:alpha,alpha-trehalase
MLGLQAAGKADMIENMVDNFSYLLDTIGFIPNGNRTYFLSRSQPPFYAAMVGLLAEEKGEDIFLKYLPYLQTEYDFWMAGSAELSADAPTHRRVVRLTDGSVLNRYWDDRDAPRAEMYHDDVETAARSDRRPEAVYRDLRAACESGWDFSSRWLADGQNLHTIHTTDIIPVDLNALLYNLETTIAKAFRLKGDSLQANRFEQQAAQRREALLRYCWDADRGFFTDYDFIAGRSTGVLSLAGAYPLFFQMAEPEQAQAAATIIQDQFLQAGGVVSTLNRIGQQWDAPNGWAPLQWMTIQGLRHYGHTALAASVKRNWVDLNLKIYHNTGKMVEKYDVQDMSLEAGGGEYPVQDGFGWTNGVLLKLLTETTPLEDKDK